MIRQTQEKKSRKHSQEQKPFPTSSYSQRRQSRRGLESTIIWGSLVNWGGAVQGHQGIAPLGVGQIIDQADLQV